MPDERNFARTILIGEVDIGHSRLVDLFKLADLAKPFYEWVESQFRARLRSRDTLSQILLSRSEAEIDGCIAHVFALAVSRTALMPKLFDGVGREYDPFKACYFFFAWLCR